MNIDTMFYVRPDEMVSRQWTVSGTIDPDYDLQWLVDGRLGYPVRGAGGSPSGDLSLSLSGAAGDVTLLAFGNHNLIVPMGVTGDLTATITPASTRPPNGIQLNPFELVTATGSPPTVDSLSLSVTGNDVTPIVGEFVAGKVRELTPVKIDDGQFSEDDHARPMAGEFLSVAPYNPRLESRRLTGSQYYTTADRDLIRAWWQAELAGTVPSILIPDPDLNDAWFVRFKGLSYKPYPKSADLWLVSFEFIEYPRNRW